MSFRMLLPNEVVFALETLEKSGHTAYCVGGCVRDALMGKAPKDYDITTSAKPDEMSKAFAGERIVETGLKHGTLTLVKNGMNIEITTYRIDGNYTDSRHPDSVTFTDRLSDDLCRRDFTVNAMAYSPSRGLVDLFGGVEDIREKRIKCVGNAVERFTEDALRILRALRFSSVLGFTLDKECSDAAEKMSRNLSVISRERIHSEISKLVCGKNAAAVVNDHAAILSSVLGIGSDEIICGAKAIKNDETMFGNENAGIEFRMAALLGCLDADKAREVISSLKTSRAEKDGILRFFRYRGTSEYSDYSLLKLMSMTDDGFPLQLFRYEVISGRMSSDSCEELKKRISALISEGICHRLNDLEINGTDLCSVGFEGKDIGDTLEILLDRVMKKEIENDRDTLLKEAIGIKSSKTY